MTAGSAASRRVLARTPVAPLPASSPTRPTGITGRMSAPPETSSPGVCSFRLPQMCGFRLPLTRVISVFAIRWETAAAWLLLTSSSGMIKGVCQQFDGVTGSASRTIPFIRRFPDRDRLISPRLTPLVQGAPERGPGEPGRTCVNEPDGGRSMQGERSR